MLRGADGFWASFKCVNIGATSDGEGEPVPQSRSGCCSPHYEDPHSSPASCFLLDLRLMKAVGKTEIE